MNRKIGIIGVGNVGSALALALVNQNICNEIILFDTDFDKAQAHAYDIMDTLTFSPTFTKIVLVDCIDDLASVDIIVNAVGPSEIATEDRLDEVEATAQIARDTFPKLMAAGFNGIILNITNPCDVITQLIQELTQLPKSRVFGTGTALDTARLHVIIGQALQLDPRSITGSVLGEHGESQFVPWSTIKVHDKNIFDIQDAVDNIDPETTAETVRLQGWKIFNGKGHTNFGIARAATKIIMAVFNNAQSILTVSTYHEPLKCYIGLPAILCNKGIRFIAYPMLTEQEEAQLVASAKVIRTSFEKIG